jgi:2-methylcitrate dehydratase PrpD
MATMSAGIADWVHNTTIDKLPPEVVEQTKLRILDLLGVMLASKDLPTAKAGKRALMATDPGTGATIVGEKDQVSVTTAAFVNGIAASMLEFDDTYLPTTMHATGLSNAVAFPEIQRRKVTGTKLIEAVALSSETMIRLSIVTPLYWFNYGLHPTGIFGVFGGVNLLAKLRGLSQAEIVAALGHAGSMSGALTAAFEDGTSTKTLHVGLAAANAFRAVALASEGVSGPTAVFEGKFGYYRAHIQTTDERHYNHITTDLGKEWKISEIATKLYPVGYPLMPQIECAIVLRDKYNIKPEDVVEIDAYIAEKAFPTLCEPPEVKRIPLTSWHGRISLQHTIAEALTMGKMDKYAYSEANIRDPRINALSAKVRHFADVEAAKDPNRSGAKIVIRLKDGREVSHDIRDFRGTARNPIGRDEYLKKFRSNVGDILSADIVEKTIEDFLKLEKLDDVAPTLARVAK